MTVETRLLQVALSPQLHHLKFQKPQHVLGKKSSNEMLLSNAKIYYIVIFLNCGYKKQGSAKDMRRFTSFRTSKRQPAFENEQHDFPNEIPLQKQNFVHKRRRCGSTRNKRKVRT
jgi:hypothetical protein